MRKYRKTLLLMLLFLFSSSAIADSVPEYASMRQHPNLAVIPEALAYSDYGFAFAKGSPLTSQFDEILKEMERDGTLSAAWEKWVVSDSAEKNMTRQK